MIFGLTTLTFCASLVFLLALGINFMRKNRTLISLYVLQSLAVVLALLSLGLEERSNGLLYAALLTFAVKSVFAPIFLGRLIGKYSIHFSAASYLSTPLTLIALAVITGFSYSIAARLTDGGSTTAIPLLFAAAFSALFLMTNRRGTLSIVIGVLSLENAIVLLATALGTGHTFALEFTVTFDIAVWIAIASAFLGMLYREFGTVDTGRAVSTLIEE
ncbi:hypothetical protein A2853_01910 [Candidatus Kaiserbacteria bacterium RIFCSPHIGHO2_01_FULL_55_17]|uniref:Hydrogenase n=1 Tax=Candidatus Kaiserbacteria bacterium RIFCSPHIGHO2_01_FULL_55_17 TaxID=1798484 RepID=A0A1F6D827_9BACT|nr:MAG: hypothetical protein A2853_01910 [Candidatus Kaiserbacteria bacterium RIFCSPHIGHO2_01_FULL_55_17]